MLNRISGGSRERELNELIVIPSATPSTTEATTQTPVGKCPRACRNALVSNAISALTVMSCPRFAVVVDPRLPNDPSRQGRHNGQSEDDEGPRQMLRHCRGGAFGVSRTDSLHDRTMLSEDIGDAPLGGRNRMNTHPHPPIPKALVKTREHKIVGCAHNDAVKFAIRFDELKRRLLLLFLLPQQPFQLRRDQVCKKGCPSHTEILDQLAGLHNRLDFGLRDRRDVSSFLRQGAQKSFRLHPQKRLPNWGS